MEPVSKIWNRKFVLLFLTNLLVLAAFYASIPIIPVHCQEIGITGARVGIVLTAMSLTTILFRPVAGYLLDNFNRYRVYLLSYDIGIGIGALLMGFMQETIGLTTGFALTAIAYVVGGILYAAYAEGYYRKLRGRAVVPAEEGREGVLLDHMERQVYTLPAAATVRDAITYFAQKRISGAPIVDPSGRMAGFLSDGDILRYLRQQDRTLAVTDSSMQFLEYFWDPEAAFAQKLDAIMDCGVLEVGVKRTITIPDHATLEEACRLLSEAGVKKVPVVCGDKVVGILSRSGLTGYLIRRYLDRTNARATAAIPAGQDQ